MAITRMMLQGCDVWLNNPRRPEEASGTSGMKAIYNGCLNFSTLDGWWDEAYDPHVGWEIGRGEEYPPEQWAHQDYLEAQALYSILENDIVPTFYTRARDGLPRAWIARIKNSIRKLAPFFNTHRMVAEYTERYYMPAHESYQRLTKPDLSRGVALAQWKQKVYSQWSNVQVLKVTTSADELKVGSEQEVTAVVQLGSLTPEDVIVQVYHGDLDTHGNIVVGNAVNMQPAESQGSGIYVFKARLAYHTTGNQGLSVRVLPNHEDLPTPFLRGLIRWA
jgi:starch phosphorylase